MITSSKFKGNRRLQLRPLVDSDANQIAELAGDWDVARMTDRIPYPYTKSDADYWISGLPDNEEVFAIDLEDRLIGLCGLMIREDRVADIGYWLGKPWWGQGYATEAIQILIQYGFKHRKLRLLTCCHFIDNPASERVIEKLGFKKSGDCEAWCEARRGNVQAVHYEMKRPRLAFLRRPAA